MLKNYLTIALRNFMKHKLYSAINVLGLGLGMASCILMILFVRDELSYDRHFEDGDDIYRMHGSYIRPNGDRVDSATSILQAAQLLEEVSDDVLETHYIFSWDMRLSVGERNGPRRVNFVGSDFFTTFNMPFLEGDPTRALSQAGTAVISADLAERMYPGGLAMGRTFKINNEMEVVIAGVLAANQPKTHLPTEVFISRSTIDEERHCGKWEKWSLGCAFTYLKLKPGADPRDLDVHIRKIVEENAPPLERLGISWKGSEWLQLSTIPLKDIHLRSKRYGEMTTGGDLSLVYVFVFLSVLILIIACINFTNLATARASDRSREVSIRKIVGAERKQIFIQVLGESVLLSTLAFIIALAIVELTLPFYNQIISKELTFSYVNNWLLMSVLLLSSICIGFVGGAYPALFLSSFRPITLSKGVFASVDRHLLLRSTLVVIQFAISIGLMSATFIVYAQMNHARAQALQVERGTVMTLSIEKSSNTKNRFKHLMTILHNIDGIETIGTSSFLPTEGKAAGVVQRHDYVPGPGEDLVKILDVASADSEFFNTYGIDMVAGRKFDNVPILYNIDRFRAPTRSEPETFATAIINEKAVAYLGYGSAEEALGQIIDFGPQRREFVTHMRVIGVMPDVNFGSAREEVMPTMFYLHPDIHHGISLLLTGENTEKTVKKIKLAWDAIFEGEPIHMKFVDESYDELFAQEVMRGNLFAGFSLLAMFIACLGLYGLASVTAERRTQEIGLRKVMGASVWDIVQLLVWQFSRPVLIANLIAWPIAFWAMRSWLNGFASHVDMTPTAFLAATAITVLVALATVSWHARKVATAKPADTLRYE